MAGPKRIPWKNTRHIKRQYQFKFCVNWLLGSFLTWPIAAMIGRRFKVMKFGVPRVPMNRWIHDFPKPEPGKSSRLTFRYYSIISSLVLGHLFARYVTDPKPMHSNEWYNRPDLKPFAAMVE